ncbi:hypothetical protein ACFX2F_025774 [Malus domestica]
MQKTLTSFENPWPTVPSPPQKLRPVRGIRAKSPMDSERKSEDVIPAKVGLRDEVEDESSSSPDDERVPKKNNIVITHHLHLPSLFIYLSTIRSISRHKIIRCSSILAQK